MPLLLSACGGGQPNPDIAHTISADDLHPAVLAIYGPSLSSCRDPLLCQSTVAIDCNAAADGPLDYYDNATAALLMRCGGACMAPRSQDSTWCKMCPPKEWTCTGQSP